MSKNISNMLDLAANLTAKGLAGMERMIDRVVDELDAADEVDIKLSSHLAWLTDQASSAMTALRMMEKHDRNQARTPEQRFKLVLEYLVELDPERRATVMAKLHELGGTGSVLS